MAQVDVGLIITAISNATKTLKETSEDVKKIGENAHATENRLKAIQVVIAGIAAEKIAELAKEFLKVDAATQLLDLHLASFAGGVHEASAIWNKLNAEFGATPFKMDAIVTAWQKFRGVTSDNEKATETIEAVVNAVAALPDGSDSKISNLTTALQRMAATGKVSVREMNAVIEDSGLTLAELAKAAGQSSQSFARSMEDGFTRGQTFIDAFIKASNDKFGDYAVRLGSTVGGAFNKIENDISGALSRLGERTNLNDRLTLAFKKMDEAIISFIDNISQADIDHFFQVLADVEPVLIAVAQTISDIAQIAIGFGTTIASLLDMMPQEALEFGIIGFVLFGVQGFLIAALIGAADQAIAKWLNEPTLLEWLKAAAGAGTHSGNHAGLFQNDKEALEKIRGDLEKLAGTKVNVLPTDQDPTRLTKALEEAHRVFNDLIDAMVKANDQVDILFAKTSGDELGANIAGIVQQTDAWKAALQNVIDKEAKLEVHTEENKLIIEAIQELMAPGSKIDQARDLAIAKEKQLYAIKTQQLQVEQEISRLNITSQVQDLKTRYNFDPKFSFLSGTAGGQLEIERRRTQLQLETQIAEAQQKQLDIDEKIAEMGGAGGPQAGRVAQLLATKEAYAGLQHQSEAALSTLSAEAIANQEFWKDLGSIIENDVGDAIVGLMDGTRTLGDVAHQIWADITRDVVRYIEKLIIAKAMGEQLDGPSGGGGGGGGGGFASLFAGLGSLFNSGAPATLGADGMTWIPGPGGFPAMANGGAFAGSIKPFARGDVITGPTLFGIAGEAGDEAIMPLTRIGGKLGVRSTGGGDTTHIHIHAIDTQSGVEFLLSNLDTIDFGLSQRRSLYRAGRTGP
jgi:tape measure domain-containing protein